VKSAGQATEWQRIGNQIDAAMIFPGADFVSVGRSCSGQITGTWEPYIPNARATVQPFGRRSSPPPTERRSSNNPVPQTPSGRMAVVAAGMEATAVIRQPAELLG